MWGIYSDHYNSKEAGSLGQDLRDLKGNQE
jgi:hypothetical protein